MAKFFSFSALRIANAFGGGMASRGETCGALTGAMMVFGLKNGRILAEDTVAKELVYDLTRQMLHQIEQEYGSINCSELTGVDMRNEAARERAKEQHVFDNICPKVIASTIEILEGLLGQNQ